MLLQIVGWIGNVFIAIGLWKIAYKLRHAFIFTIIGEVIWIGKALAAGMYDLAAMCVVFAFLAARNWWKWGQNAS